MKRYTAVTFVTAVLLGAGGAPADLGAAEKVRERSAVVVSEQKVNINTATESDLRKLKGVGSALAKKILEYRNAHGEFKKPEDLRNVEGVGQSLWERHRQRITVR
jgi:competence ComEA-like helix-hairpin-helix protein